MNKSSFNGSLTDTSLLKRSQLAAIEAKQKELEAEEAEIKLE